jgi:serine phosphatase RsbU (regulator of sigma subunit)/anti-sigma regulatory factor (Ser/Thr protein kinase)
MAVIVPLVSQGEVHAVLGLGPRLSGLDYSRDDKRLLANLAAQAAPALRVTQLVRQQRAEVQARTRLDHELRLAREIQQYFLPRQLPQLNDWSIDAHYAPARAVGGDFYDFIELPDNKLGLVIGDVADKGMPAALLMASTRSLLRATAQRLIHPSDVLAHVNDVLVPDTPPNIFITCLYGVLDLTNGGLTYANAGHTPPYVRRDGGQTVLLRARGMPLGVVSGQRYEAPETCLQREDLLLLYSDGLVEAHNSQREMFGFERLQEFIGHQLGRPSELTSALLAELDRHVGPGWEQEDDVTLVSLQRTTGDSTLADFTVRRRLGEERRAVAQVVQAIADWHMDGPQLDRIRTAVAEATLNAIEYADPDRPDVPIFVSVRASNRVVKVQITNPCGPRSEKGRGDAPDLAAKLAGRQELRGWGQFLMRHLADDVTITRDAGDYCVELTFTIP